MTDLQLLERHQKPERQTPRLKSFGVMALVLAGTLGLIASVEAAQTPPPTPLINPPLTAPPSTANDSVMLVPPQRGGVALVLFHDPSGGLQLVPISEVKEKFMEGYVPVRAAEIGEIIRSLNEENSRLKEENAKLLRRQMPNIVVTPSQAPAPTVAPTPTSSQQDLRRQMLMQWFMLQERNRPRTYNLNVRDCTKYPALCVGQ